jgi:type VI secretion system protein ImpC
VDVAGPQGGRIDGLPAIDERAATGRTQPVEVVLSERKEAELSELGLMPVAVARAQQYVGFNAANSLHWANAQQGSRSMDAETLGDKLSAQFPYLFLVCRIAHYLKVIQRDMVGAMRTAAELQTELESWLRRYVSDVDQPAPELRGRRPLRQAHLVLADDPADASRFHMHLDLMPHAKLMNSEFSLAVDGVLGRL